EFGFANAIDGDTVLVGAPLHDSEVGYRSGKAYVFVRTGAAWTQQTDLAAVSGNTALVSAIGDSQAGLNAGACYVLDRSGTSWTQRQKLIAFDAASGDGFGEFVALDLDTAVVGARFHDGGGADSGVAYVFTRSGVAWSQQQELSA